MSTEFEQKAARVNKNWTESAVNYSSGIRKELDGFKRQAWLDLINTHGALKPGSKILDIGTGPGFFAIILSLQGHDVTAIDYTEAMVEEARANAAQYGANAVFAQGDAMDLQFADNSFDMIINRNVAWTIIDAERAYKDWLRVLKPGGRLLLFDANWNRRLFHEELRLQYEADLKELAEKYPDYKRHDHTPDMEDFRRQMPMCQRIRPEWDLEALQRVGYANIECVTDFQEKIYTPEELIMNRSTPMFLLKADKA